MPTHYATLKVATDAPIDVIRAAYRVLAARHHPDRCDGDVDALRRMQQVNEAWRLLSDPVARSRYDRELRRAWRRRSSDGGEGVAASGAKVAPVDVAACPPAPVRQRVAATYAEFAGLGRR
ncbi:J domain-containing protein [Lysobacter sp. TY2-98]|uniref:J domain-containing protein n=1 Tax=Lysobacter sp. TY2-98 TaxID=2290922 RepID=UPI0013B41E5F|nr:J domain-containing protein [Lysobacter sp. TY2-98]